MLHTTKPNDFSSKFDVVSCFLESGGEILLLKRLDHKPEGGLWGAPAGKVDPGETLNEAMSREVYQETGVRIDDFEYLGKLYVRYPAYDFVYHTYKRKLASRPDIRVKGDEHDRFIWVSPSGALRMPLVLDMDGCIRKYYSLG